MLISDLRFLPLPTDDNGMVERMWTSRGRAVVRTSRQVVAAPDDGDVQRAETALKLVAGAPAAPGGEEDGGPGRAGRGPPG